MLKKYEDSPKNVKKKAKLISINMKGSMLNMEISDCCTGITNILKAIDETEEDLQLRLSIKSARQIMDENEASYQNQIREPNKRLDRKFKKLMQSQNHLPDIEYDESFIKILAEWTFR